MATTTNLSTLKIHKLTQAQYDREVENGTIDENALYLTPEEEIDLSLYMTKTNPTGNGSFSMNRLSGTTIGAYSFAEGNLNTASEHCSHAEGGDTVASAYYSHAEGRGTTASEYASHAEGYYTTTSGEASHAEGWFATASGDYSHAEGYQTEANGLSSHAEGDSTIASEQCSHTEGAGTKVTSDSSVTATVNETEARGFCGHAEGYYTVSCGAISHAEGNGTKASGHYSHAEGYNTVASGNKSHAEGNRVIASGTASHAEGGGGTYDDVEKFTTASGHTSHAEGAGTEAIGGGSHAEGYFTVAEGDYSHAEGFLTKTSNNYAHSEGQSTTASGLSSHAEGGFTTASGSYAHAEGMSTTASGSYAHAAGRSTTALQGQYVIGHYNGSSTAGSGSGTTGDAFIIGKGTSSSKSNAFRVTYAGKAYVATTGVAVGADYAEYFEWKDSNPNNEDRRGYFVTLDGENIKIAEPNDYILGIVSGMPCIIGNGDECWRGRYIQDEFGAFITEEFEYEEEVFNKETGEMETVTRIGTKYKENPEYDSTRPYIQREDRPEWDTVGMMGVLSVRDDGTCQINGFCKVAKGGIATASESGYRVISRVNENIVKVVFK